MKPLTIIVITYNRLEYTRRTINSLIATAPTAKIIIYDNASTDEGVIQAIKDYGMTQDVTVIFGEKNLGWAGAVNEAMKDVDTEFVLISNNDVEYHNGWYNELLSLYEKYPQVGIMGVWKHTAHGISKDHGDLLEKDDMPAVGWLMKKSVIDEIGPIPERGPCSTKGGNGEDSNYVNMVRMNGYWIAAPKEDVAIHIDGY